MKVGDLVRSVDGTCESGHWCGCWFCSHNSSRVGVIVKRWPRDRDPLAVIAPKASVHHDGYWSILFDAGEKSLYGSELEVINESR